MSSQPDERICPLMWGDVVKVVKVWDTVWSRHGVKPVGSIGKVVDSTDHGNLLVLFDDGSRIPYIPEELELIDNKPLPLPG